jgi:uncharacterized protein DUF3775
MERFIHTENLKLYRQRLADPKHQRCRAQDDAIAPPTIAKARQFDVKDVVTDPDDSSNASDDAMLSVLEDHRGDPVQSELATIIRGLNEDEQIELVALAWLGCNNGDLAGGRLVGMVTDRDVACRAVLDGKLDKLVARERRGLLLA